MLSRTSPGILHLWYPWCVALWIFGFAPAASPQSNCPARTEQTQLIFSTSFTPFETISCDPIGLVYDCSIKFITDVPCTIFEVVFSDFDPNRDQGVRLLDSSNNQIIYYDGLSFAPIVGKEVNYTTSSIVSSFQSTAASRMQNVSITDLLQTLEFISGPQGCFPGAPKFSGYIVPHGCSAGTAPGSSSAVAASAGSGTGASLMIPVESLIFVAATVGGIIALVAFGSLTLGATFGGLVLFALFIMVLHNGSSGHSSVGLLAA